MDSFVDRCYHKSSVCVVPAEPSNEQSLCLTDHRLCFFSVVLHDSQLLHGTWQHSEIFFSTD